MQSVTYFRENKQVFYTSPQPQVGQILPDARLLIFPTTGPTNADGRQQPVKSIGSVELMLPTTLTDQLASIELADYNGRSKVDSKTETNDSDDDVPDLVEVSTKATASSADISSSDSSRNGVSSRSWGPSYWNTMHRLAAEIDNEHLDLPFRWRLKTMLNQLVEEEKQRYGCSYQSATIVSPSTSSLEPSKDTKVDKVDKVDNLPADSSQLSYFSKLRAMVKDKVREMGIIAFASPKIDDIRILSTDVVIDIEALEDLKTTKDTLTILKPTKETAQLEEGKISGAADSALKNQNPKVFVCGFSTS